MQAFRSKRFELGHKLGEGSIGIVYEAHDREQNMRVALKLLRRVVPAGLYRLKQEFRALRSISHPNIVTLYDLLCEDDHWFITMELIEGADLVSHVRAAGHKAAHDAEHGAAQGSKTGLPHFHDLVDESRLRHVLAQMAQALHAMHMAGLVHRDLKPSNVRVTELGRAVLMDFSIAAEAQGILDHNGSGSVVLGTPLYMAPEQAAGDPPGPAIDWYALGVMMYQSITGSLPFEGHWDEVLIEKQERDPGPPRERVAGVPEDLDELCHALLSRLPQHRPPGHEILARLGVASRDTVSVLHGMNEAAFVGRDTELALLDHGYQQVRAGESVCVLFRGVAGMGKSKLLQRFANQLIKTPGEAVIVLSGSCQRPGRAPWSLRCYNALDDIMDALSRTLLELPGERLQKVLPEDVALVAGMFPSLLRVAGVDCAPRATTARGHEHAGERRDRAVNALRRLLAELAAWRPLVVCIDDAQWADADSLEVLRELLRPPAPARVLWLLAEEDRGDGDSDGASNNTAAGLDQALALGASGTFHKVDLKPLRPAAQRTLLEQWLGSRATALEQDGPSSMVQASTPLYLSELARLAIETRMSDARTAEARAGEARADRPRAGEPGQLDDVLEQRIRNLPESGRALLETVALAGQPAPLSLLARATHQGMGEAERASAMLRAARLIRVARPGREPWLVPYHHKVSEIVDRLLAGEHRRELHQRLALALERLGRASSDALAHHWCAAGDADKALAHVRAAAQNAAERLAFARAADLYATARELAEPGSPTMQSLLSSLGHALALCGRHVDAADAFRQAAHDSDADLAVELEREAADQLLRGGHIRDGLDQLGDIAARLGAPPGAQGAAGRPLGQRVRLLLRGQRFRARSESEIAARDLDRLDTLYATALPLTLIDHRRGQVVQSEHLLIALRHGEPARVARALACQVPAAVLKGGRGQGRAQSLVREVMDTIRQLDDAGLVDARVDGLAHLGLGLVELCDPGESDRAAAERHLARAIELFATEVRNGHWELMTARYLCCVARIGQGRIREATAQVPRWLTRARRSGDVVARTLFGCRPAMWRAMRKDRVDHELAAVAAIADCWHGEPTDAARYLVAAATVMGHVYRHDGDAARAAMDEYTRHAGHAHLAHTPLLVIDNHVLAGRVAWLAGDVARAARAARKLGRMTAAVARAHAAVLDAALAHGSGDGERAQAQLAQAATLFDHAGAEHFASGAKFRLGQMLGDDRGRSHIAEAMQWCRRENIANIDRMFDYLCPWIRRTVDV